MPETFQIVDLEESEKDRIDRIANFLFDCFTKYAPAWLPDEKACQKQIQDSFESNRRSRVAISEDGHSVGWIGAITDKAVWEIHPIAVSPSHRRLGLGRRLVADIERLARAEGAVSVWAGTSDETNSTSFSSIDLYSEPGRSFENVQAPPDHPINFWLGVGYSIVGVMPDEEGLGKPGIHFARRIV